MLTCGPRVFALNRQFSGLSKQVCNLCNTLNQQLGGGTFSTKDDSYNRTFINDTFSIKVVQSRRFFSTANSYTTSETILSEQSSPLPNVKQNLEPEASNSNVNPFDARDYFGVEKLFTIKDLFNARVHLGHTVRSMVPQMRPFIFGTRFDMCVFDLDETALLLKQALNFIAHVAHRGGIILFIARQPQMGHMVERTAVECGEYAQCRQWPTEVFTAPNKVD